ITYFNSPDEARSVGAEVQALGRRALVVKADMSEHEDVETLARVVAAELGRLDIVVSNAAGGGFRNVLDASLRQFDYAMRVNVRALMLLAQHAAPLFEKRTLPRARVVTITSLGGTRALPQYGLIGAAKGAIESMTRHLAMELGPRGVNVNCVCAGTVDTGALRHLPEVEQVLAARRARSLTGLDLTPEDVAGAVLFLCSSLADQVQGHTLVIDGGSSIQVA
ncbi:MAG: SDR family oxidoreductase, partial [Myxococcales bacterium]|nr:SDR family oxidoreductase [Myxococcales bacterium]